MRGMIEKNDIVEDWLALFLQSKIYLMRWI